MPRMAVSSLGNRSPLDRNHLQLFCVSLGQYLFGKIDYFDKFGGIFGGMQEIEH